MSTSFFPLKHMAIAFVLLFSSVAFISCSKQEETKLTISIKRVKGKDTLIAPYARIYIWRDDIKEAGTSDKEGVFSAIFKGEVYLKARAEVDTINALPAPDSVFVAHFYKNLEIHVLQGKETFQTMYVNTNFQDTLTN